MRKKVGVAPHTAVCKYKLWMPSSLRLGVNKSIQSLVPSSWRPTWYLVLLISTVITENLEWYNCTILRTEELIQACALRLKPLCRTTTGGLSPLELRHLLYNVQLHTSDCIPSIAHIVRGWPKSRALFLVSTSSASGTRLGSCVLLLVYVTPKITEVYFFPDIWGIKCMRKQCVPGALSPPPLTPGYEASAGLASYPNPF